MMDVDGGGSISLREINRVLMGETVRYVTVTFDHPDTGILFGLDEEKYVYIAEFERESVASQHPTLVRHMRLFRMNNYKLKPKVPKELHRVHQELLRVSTHDKTPARRLMLPPEEMLNDARYRLSGLYNHLGCQQL